MTSKKIKELQTELVENLIKNMTLSELVLKLTSSCYDLSYSKNLDNKELILKSLLIERVDQLTKENIELKKEIAYLKLSCTCQIEDLD